METEQKYKIEYKFGVSHGFLSGFLSKLFTKWKVLDNYSDIEGVKGLLNEDNQKRISGLEQEADSTIVEVESKPNWSRERWDEYREGRISDKPDISYNLYKVTPKLKVSFERQD